jgi:hypothetical protein
MPAFYFVVPAFVIGERILQQIADGPASEI